MSPTRWTVTVGDAAAIELEGLVRRYGERTALAGVSVAVPAGATLVVFGPNGAGKSTLLRVLATLLRPQGGTARVLGEELPRRCVEGARAHRPARPRAAAAPRPQRAREPALPRAPARRRVRAHRRAARPGRPARCAPTSRSASCRAGWCSASPPAARCCTSPTCCCSTSRPRTSTRPRPTRSSRVVGRTSGRTRVVTSHDPARGLAEADVVLGLRGGRAELSGAATEAEVRELYR